MIKILFINKSNKINKTESNYLFLFNFLHQLYLQSKKFYLQMILDSSCNFRKKMMIQYSNEIQKKKN